MLHEFCGILSGQLCTRVVLAQRLLPLHEYMFFYGCPFYLKTLRGDLKLKMKDVEAKKQGTEILLEEMGVQRSEAEAQQVQI